MLGKHLAALETLPLAQCKSELPCSLPIVIQHPEDNGNSKFIIRLITKYCCHSICCEVCGLESDFSLGFFFDITILDSHTTISVPFA